MDFHLNILQTKKYHLKPNIIFFGELPESIVHGISISNKINIDILKEKYNVIIISEESKISDHSKFTYYKFLKILKYLYLLLKFKKKFIKIDIFYTSISISRFGMLKNIIIILFFKIMNYKSKIILHNYRGDLNIFYNKNIINKLLTKTLLLISNTVIFLSDSLISDTLKSYLNKFKVVHNCVNDNNSYLKKSSNNFKLIYISHFIKSKGIYDLLAALKILEFKKINFEINLYGQFTNNHDEEIIKTYNSSKIKVNDFLKDDIKMKSINEASCLILPSHNEGQPQIILEAMFLGTPVIATNVGDIPTMLGKDYPFLVEANSPESLANAIENFLKLKNEEFLALSYSLKDRFNKYYSFQTHKLQLLSSFE